MPKIDHGQNIFRPFHVLEQCLFTTNETDLDYNHQKKNAQVVSQVNEKLRTEDHRKLGNFKKIPVMLGFDNQYPAGHPKKTKFDIRTRK